MTGEVPRVCGKDLVAPKLSITLTGSPPRVREGRNRRIPRPNSIRITPACAGRTVEVYQAWTGERDHPRVCGKDDVKHHVDCAKLGSPPRVREGLHAVDRTVQTARITPACAGRTCAHGIGSAISRGSPPRVREGPAIRNRSSCAVKDHPRVCGKDSAP